MIKHNAKCKDTEQRSQADTKQQQHDGHMQPRGDDKVTFTLKCTVSAFTVVIHLCRTAKALVHEMDLQLHLLAACFSSSSTSFCLSQFKDFNLGQHRLTKETSPRRGLKFYPVITGIKLALEIITTRWHCGSADEKTCLESLLIILRKIGNDSIWLGVYEQLLRFI